MKSLEIVNKEIELIHNQLNDYDEEDEEYGFYPSYDTLMYELNNYNKIKQDLEVLEIIRKKDVNLATLKLCIIRTDTIEQLLSKYNKSRYFTQDELTLEELLKLKQWLEEN